MCIRDRANIDVASRLTNIEMYDCVNCNDVHCNLHNEQLEDYCMNVLEAVDSVAVNCLSSSGGSHKGERKGELLDGISLSNLIKMNPYFGALVGKVLAPLYQVHYMVQ